MDRLSKFIEWADREPNINVNFLIYSRYNHIEKCIQRCYEAKIMIVDDVRKNNIVQMKSGLGFSIDEALDRVWNSYKGEKL